jgi:hypothetical protein
MSNEQYEENKEIEILELNEQDLEDVAGGVSPFSAGFNNARFTFANEFKANGVGAAFKSLRPAWKEGREVGKRFSEIAKKPMTEGQFNTHLNNLGLKRSDVNLK